MINEKINLLNFKIRIMLECASLSWWADFFNSQPYTCSPLFRERRVRCGAWDILKLSNKILKKYTYLLSMPLGVNSPVYGCLHRQKQEKFIEHLWSKWFGVLLSLETLSKINQNLWLQKLYWVFLGYSKTMKENFEENHLQLTPQKSLLHY